MKNMMKRFAVKLAVLVILITSISPVFTKPAMAANRNEFVGGWYMYEDNRFGLQMEIRNDSVISYHRSTDPSYESNYNYNTDLDGHLYSYFSDGSEQQVYTMINHDYMVDRDGDHWIRYY